MTEKNEVKENEEQEEKSKKMISKIMENYKSRNDIICGELDLASVHGGTTGSNREDFWMNLFRDIIPQKFAMEKNVIIIDSKGNCSNEVDIAVIDNQYTPYVFKYGNLKFIPIEAVAIAIECKSTSWDKDSLEKWSTNIEKLEASSAGITRIVSGNAIGVTNTSQKRTTPIKILASIRLNTDGETIEKIEDYFDFILTYKTPDSNDDEKKQKKRKRKKATKHILHYEVPNANKKLGWWSEKLNNHDESDKEIEDKPLRIKVFGHKNPYIKSKLEQYNTNNIFESAEIDIIEKGEDKDGNVIEDAYYVIEDTLESLEIKENPLLSLNFQLNQLLMLINNPMTFPHFAYAKMFKDAVDEN